VLGRRAGVDVEVLHRSLVASPANSNFLEHDVLSVFQGDYDMRSRWPLSARISAWPSTWDASTVCHSS
jgi:hypothetical protein